MSSAGCKVAAKDVVREQVELQRLDAAARRQGVIASEALRRDARAVRLADAGEIAALIGGRRERGAQRVEVRPNPIEVRQQVVTSVLGTICHPCARAGQMSGPRHG